MHDYRYPAVNTLVEVRRLHELHYTRSCTQLNRDIQETPLPHEIRCWRSPALADRQQFHVWW